VFRRDVELWIEDESLRRVGVRVDDDRAIVELARSRRNRIRRGLRQYGRSIRKKGCNERDCAHE
jgi:hypothetical protein